MRCERSIALLGFLSNNNRTAAALWTTKVASDRAEALEPLAPASSRRTSAVVICHTGTPGSSCRCRCRRHRGARSRAISIRISVITFRDIAASAIPNVTQRPWLTTSAPILIGFLGKLVRERGSGSTARPRPTL